MRRLGLISILLIWALSGCGADTSAPKQSHAAESAPSQSYLTQPESPKPPLAAQIPFQAEYHGLTLSDPFHWLKDQSYPEVDDEAVLNYLNQENTYFNNFMSQHQTLVDRLYEEFKGRENEEDSAVPWQEGDYIYRWYFRPGEEYRVWARRKINGDEEVIVLDENTMAAGKEYHRISDFVISPNGRYLVYGIDNIGSERYTLKVKDLDSGALLIDSIDETSGNVVWAADNSTLFYVVVSKEWRPYLVKRHVLGDDFTKDATVFEEKDTGFFVSVGKTQSGKFIGIQTGTQITSEFHFIPADQPTVEPKLMASRDLGIEYYPDHAHDTFYIRTNDKHVNFRLATVTDANPDYKNWQTLIAGSDNYYLTNILPLQSHLILEGKRNGLDEIALRTYSGETQSIAFPESVYAAGISNNPEFVSDHVRINYQSMVTPPSTFDFIFADKTLELKKEKVIPSGYDKTQYQTERIMATARDDAKVPVSIVYKKGFKKDGSQPMHLYGYGAYGAGMPPSFSTTNLSLLDRGFAFAIAHIRGGDEMGYQWYLDGKLKQRTNTFNDFVDVAKFLIAENYVSAGNISISGRSAGGELMGAVTIQAPELWRSVNLIVPFVDVLNTMLDDSLPLTPPEWPEWGNPITSKEDYQTIAAYSPYDNIEAQSYPPMLVAGGLNDPRVTYWEPAKWTAKMRTTKTDNNLLIMRMHMGAGHFSSSGRFARLKDDAQEFAFMLLAHGIQE
jgi:oligopeptidase B